MRNSLIIDLATMAACLAIRCVAARALMPILIIKERKQVVKTTDIGHTRESVRANET